LAERVIGILRESYADFGPTLAAEKLRSGHQIDLAKETVRQLQIAAGRWIPRRLRPPKVQQPRARRACSVRLEFARATDRELDDHGRDRGPSGPGRCPILPSPARQRHVRDIVKEASGHRRERRWPWRAHGVRAA